MFRLGFAQTPLGELIVFPRTTYLDLLLRRGRGRKDGGKGKTEEGEERMCAVGTFNYFML